MHINPYTSAFLPNFSGRVKQDKVKTAESIVKKPAQYHLEFSKKLQDTLIDNLNSLSSDLKTKTPDYKNYVIEFTTDGRRKSPIDKADRSRAKYMQATLRVIDVEKKRAYESSMELNNGEFSRINHEADSKSVCEKLFTPVRDRVLGFKIPKQKRVSLPIKADELILKMHQQEGIYYDKQKLASELIQLPDELQEAVIANINSLSNNLRANTPENIDYEIIAEIGKEKGKAKFGDASKWTPSEITFLRVDVRSDLTRFSKSTDLIHKDSKGVYEPWVKKPEALWTDCFNDLTQDIISYTNEQTSWKNDNYGCRQVFDRLV